jgi:opacity protein-like surface antigen
LTGLFLDDFGAERSTTMTSGHQNQYQTAFHSLALFMDIPAQIARLLAVAPCWREIMSPYSYTKTARLNSVGEWLNRLLKKTDESHRFGMPKHTQQIFALIGVVLPILIISNPSMARANDFEVGVFAGGSIASNEVNSESANATLGASPATLTNTYEVDKNLGFLAGVTAGIKTENGFVFEGEAAYRRTGFDALGTLTADVGGMTQSLPAQGEGIISGYSFMANGWYDFLNRDSKGVRPFIGGGIGVVVKKSSGELRSQGPLFGLTVSNTTGLGNNQETGFAWQAGAGLRTDVSDKMTASVSYRYFDGGEINDEFNFNMHSIVFGVSF